MGLFNRASPRDTSSSSADNDSTTPEGKKEKGGWRRPANTAFKQQRLKAWQPILTPKTVLPTLFIIGLIFAPIGGLLVWGSSQVSEITLDYTECENQTPSNGSLAFTDLKSYSYRMRSADASAHWNTPRFAFVANASSTNPAQKGTCVVQFDVPADMGAPVFLYYKLTKFYQNHRRYVKSIDSDQLKGKAVSVSTLNSGDCKPLDSINGKAVYPCGLIANSMFNDTFTNLTFQNPPSGAASTYNFSQTGIAWPGERKKYTNAPAYNASDVVPPPNWAARYPNGYADGFPPLASDEHFQNWMRTAGLPTFTKLYGRNDGAGLQRGTYQVNVTLDFPVLPYGGSKAIVLSTVSWIGGKNPFLGWAYVAAASVFILLAVAGTARHLIKPRRLGDMSLLSWNH